MSLHPIVPPLATFNVSARLANPLDIPRSFTIGGAVVAASDLDALDEFAARILQPFANAGFPVEVYSITAYGKTAATILLPTSTTDDRRRTELAHAENVLDLLDRRTGKVWLRVIDWDPLDRRPKLVAPIIVARRNARAERSAA